MVSHSSSSNEEVHLVSGQPLMWRGKGIPGHPLLILCLQLNGLPRLVGLESLPTDWVASLFVR